MTHGLRYQKFYLQRAVPHLRDAKGNYAIAAAAASTGKSRQKNPTTKRAELGAAKQIKCGKWYHEKLIVM